MSPRRPDSSAAYLRPYILATERHGASFEATLWASRESQRARFDAIADMVDLRARAVIDAGCGMGDLAARLIERGTDVAAYLGLEGVEDIARAGAARALPRSTILHTDFARRDEAFPEALSLVRTIAPAAPAAIIFSGSLNTFHQRDARRVLDRAWRTLGAGDVLVFNFLNDLCEPDLRRQSAAPARRFDTRAMLAWAAERSPAVRYRQDYLPRGHDATISIAAP